LEPLRLLDAITKIRKVERTREDTSGGLAEHLQEGCAEESKVRDVTREQAHRSSALGGALAPELVDAATHRHRLVRRSGEDVVERDREDLRHPPAVISLLRV